MPSKSQPSVNGSPIVLEDASEISVAGQVFPSSIVAQWRAWAAVLIRMNNLLSVTDANGVRLSSVQTCEPREGTGILFVVKGQVKKRAVKGFHRSENVADGVHTLIHRIEAGSMDWRDDLPYASRMPVTDGVIAPLGAPPPL